MAKGFHKEMGNYLSKRNHKPLEFTKSKPSQTVEEYDELAGVSDTQTTILQKEENVWDTIKKSVHNVVGKVQQSAPEEAPAFDDKGNIVDKDAYEEQLAQSQNVIQKSGKLVTNLFSKLDVFDIIGKKSTATAQAEYAEMEEFGEVIQTSQDVKELAHVSAHILRLLPPEQLDSFKKSDEFKQYKNILKRNNIIK